MNRLYWRFSRIYWTDWGSEARIETARGDGSDRKVIFKIPQETAWPNGLAIDEKGTFVIMVSSETLIVAVVVFTKYLFFS